MSGPRIISRHHHVDVCLSCGAEHGGLRLVSHNGIETFRCPVSNGIVSGTEASIVVDAGVDAEAELDVDDTPDLAPADKPSDEVGVENTEDASSPEVEVVTSFAADPDDVEAVESPE